MRRNKKNEPEHVRQARKRVRAKKWFYRHFSIYAVFSLFFFFMNMVIDGTHDIWFIYPVLSWGTIIATQYLMTFGLPFTKAGTKEWEEKELAKELAKVAPAVLPLAQAIDKGVDMDEHLELREVAEVAAEKAKEPIYRTDDLV